MEEYKNQEQVSEFLTKNQIIQNLFQNETDAVVVTDERSVIEHINPEFTRLFGYTEKEAVGRPVSELLMDEGDRDLRKSGSENDNEDKNRIRIIRSRKSGRKISVFSRIIPIMAGNRAIGGFAYYRGVSQ